MGDFGCTLSDVWFRTLSQHVVKPVLKIGMSHLCQWKVVDTMEKLLSWVCRANLAITEERLA